MHVCPWPRGCSQTAYDGLCYYHQKVADGYLDIHPASERRMKPASDQVDDESLGLRNLLNRLEAVLLAPVRRRRRRGA